MWVPQLNEFGQPMYLSIADALARDISNGVLNEGDRLPTLRELATTLNVTPGTISRAYSEAQRRRLVQGEVGRGTYVLNQKQLELPASNNAAPLNLGQSELLDLSIIKPYSETLEYWLRDALVGMAKSTDFARALDYAPRWRASGSSRGGCAMAAPFIARCAMAASGDHRRRAAWFDGRDECVDQCR